MSQALVLRPTTGLSAITLSVYPVGSHDPYYSRLQRFDSKKVELYLLSLSWGLDMGPTVVQEIVAALQVRLPAATMSAETFLVFLAEIVSTFSARHPDYSVLAGRVYTCYHHRRVAKRFSSWVLSYENATPSVFTDTLIEVVRQNTDTLDGAVMHKRDFDFTYRAMQTFEKSYLMKDGRELVERLQFLFMRVAIGIHGRCIDDVLETYELLSTRKISFASPTLWNGGLANRHFASCYVYEPFTFDSRAAIPSFSTLSSLWASDGGIGISLGDVPATRTTRAAPGYRFHNIFPALWIPHLFMRRLENDEMWSLFDPAVVRALSELYGDHFESTYTDYERRGIASTTLRARALWETIADAIRETGTPFLMYADNVNAKNNQMNLGVIKSANLCTEIVQYSSVVETAVCTLASLCLPRFLRLDGTFDCGELHRVTKLVIRALDRIIDLADYPTADSTVSALRSRSVGLGVQGLADVFGYCEFPFASPEARALNKRIFETIYHASLESSSELAERLGPYDAWLLSPAQQGVLQVDMWNAATSEEYDFDALRDRIKRTGLRNSVLTAQMPTASTAQLFGNSEGVDPYLSNVIQFRLLSGNFNEISRPLVTALQKRGLWSDNVRERVLASEGSIQDIDEIPDDLKPVFKTAFELDPIELVNLAADRGPFIDQSQSLTLFIASPTPQILMDVQLHAWKCGLKTGAYYVRSKPAARPQSFGVARVAPKAEASTFLQLEEPLITERVSCPCDA
ncbi:hypothetical protein GSI_11998 [Ganoderma sinense ZZ0214-1]|uniref:Ribonucleoside-diphosphate reductase n=1 Tax=Ganoderma sinense ZZ0214-1 TaxID=1077348 RepID=A0A2G8RXK9_9APHY|nr:hypothetical protein GSI_11998 [Ganoderma sinense ZZ0214-1]